MFKALAIIPIVTAMVLAQTAAPSSLIPQGISDKCSTFMKTLDSNTAITGCTSVVSKATASAGKADVASTLETLCSASTNTACSTELFSGQLSDFANACDDELTANPNKAVVAIYDALFVIQPLFTAICSKDDGGNFCGVQAKLPQGSDAKTMQAALSSPSQSNAAALIPNTDTFNKYNIPFLFLSNPITADQCNVCTRKIMNSYMNFEAAATYEPGLGKSQLLSGQLDLYNSIEGVCGETFLDQAGVVKAAGGLSGGTLSPNGATHVSGVAGGLIATGMSVLALVASSWL